MSERNEQSTEPDAVSELLGETVGRVVVALERIADALEASVPPRKVGFFEWLAGE